MDAFSERVIQRVAELKLRAAMEEGEFENLPGFGKPFEFDELDYDPNWWIRRKMEREKLVQKLRDKQLGALTDPDPATNKIEK